MKKNFKYYVLVWAILLVMFQITVFATPGEIAGISKFDASFWVGYVFIMIAFVGQLVCAYVALNTNDRRKLFLNIPLVTISYTAFLVSFVCGALCMAVPGLPYWVGIVVCVLMLGLSAIAVVQAKAAADLVSNVGDKVKAKTLFIRVLTADAESLMAKAATDSSKAACKKVYEAVRFSDPMSDEALSGIESQITLKFNEFSKAVTADAKQAAAMAEELVVLLGDRNKRCKLLK